jgi:hypothetical protein
MNGGRPIQTASFVIFKPIFLLDTGASVRRETVQQTVTAGAPEIGL